MEPPGEFIFLITLFLTATVVLAINAEKRYVPASSACIVAGAVMGALLWPTGWSGALTSNGLDVASLVSFNSDVFYYVLLPPIICQHRLAAMGK